MSHTTKRRTTAKRKPKHRGRLWLSTLILCVIAAVLTVALHKAYNAYIRAIYPLKYTAIVSAACADYDIAPSLVYSIMRTESNFDEQAHSVADAMGLMQVTATGLDWAHIRSDEFDSVTVEQLYQPDINIRLGVYILSLLFEQFDSEQAAVAAYNAGIGTVEDWLKDTAYSHDGKTLHTVPYEETRNYIQIVDSSKQIYQDLYQLD